jgi:hypothetical protein
MSIIHKILDLDLHRVKDSKSMSRVLFIETPIKKEFLPCVVSSSTKGKFLINNTMTGDGRIRSGAFECSEETLDEILPTLFEKCYELSTDRQFSNRFSSIKDAISYLRNTSGYKNQPHYGFFPTKTLSKLTKGHVIEDGILDKSCRIIYGNFKNIVFVSRPDFVGLVTRLPNNYNSILLHNIELGMAFV